MDVSVFYSFVFLSKRTVTMFVNVLIICQILATSWLTPRIRQPRLLVSMCPVTGENWHGLV